MSIETDTPVTVTKAPTYTIGQDVDYKTEPPNILESQISASETQITPQNSWMRTQRQFFEGGPVETIIRNDKNTQINLTKIPTKEDPPHIDSSIRMTQEGKTYTLRYGHETNDFKRWELIKTIPSDESNGTGEQTVFKISQATPDFILDQTEIPDWENIIKHTNEILENLPNEYLEKKILQEAWNQITISSSKDIETQKPESLRKKAFDDAFFKEKRPSVWQKVQNRVNKFFNGTPKPTHNRLGPHEYSSNRF